MWLEYFAQYMDIILPQFRAEEIWNYKSDLCMIGMSYLAEATGDDAWKRRAENLGKWLVKEDGSIANWNGVEHNIDKVSFGKSFRVLRDVTGDDRYDEGIKRAYSFLDTYPRTQTGNFWHKDIYPNQVWLDGLYMAMPFYAKCLAETGDDRWDDIIDQFQSAHRLLWNEEKHLYIHGCDVSRKAAWADPQTGRSPAVWLRAEGWFLMALADTYELAKGRTDRAEELTELLRRGIAGIMPYQDEAAKMFWQVVDMPKLKDNYLETSGSAMIAYALMKGARLGMLDESCSEQGSLIVDGIRDTYLKQENGEWHLYGICASAGLGDGPDPYNPKGRSGKPEYYVSEVQRADNEHGTAACMMAVSEQIRRNHKK